MWQPTSFGRLFEGVSIAKQHTVEDNHAQEQRQGHDQPEAYDSSEQIERQSEYQGGNQNKFLLSWEDLQENLILPVQIFGRSALLWFSFAFIALYFKIIIFFFFIP